jgi:hypothetical protein
MQLAELLARMNGSTMLQRWERSQNLVGTEIEIIAQISDIGPNLIFLTAVAGMPDNISIKVPFRGEALNKQLLDVDKGDFVKLLARLRDASYGSSYDFELTSILEHSKSATPRNTKQT